jgi:hypothetical protein
MQNNNFPLDFSHVGKNLSLDWEFWEQAVRKFMCAENRGNDTRLQKSAEA